MKRGIYTAIIILLSCFSLFSQDKKGKVTREKKPEKAKSIIKNIPVQAQYSNKLVIKELYFNKRIDFTGKGEILEVEFRAKNKLDDPLDLYIFVIATFEKTQKIRTSFESPIPPKERIRSFVPFPDDIKNFQYPDSKNKGDVKLIKYPRDSKAGVNPKTGKPYHIDESLFIRTYHLSKYRNNYFFFNRVTIFIFEKDGSPLFRQTYNISGIRR